MIAVELSESTFKRLQTHAKPLVDNTSSVIDMLLDFFEVSQSSSKPVASQNGSLHNGVKKFGPSEAPPLTHTKLSEARFGAISIPRPNWNELMRTAIEAGLDRYGSLDELVRVTDARCVSGEKNDEGFSPLGSRGISVQGVAANDAWRIAYGLARKLSLPIAVTFAWREKDGADRPGEIGAISWSPSR